MAIYDNDGTTNTEIGNLYDNDGTTNYQIGEVYDNDGTTNSLVYASNLYLWSGDPTTSVLSGYITAHGSDTITQDNWRGKFGDGLHANSAGNIGFYVASGDYECHGIWQTPIDITDYNKLVFTCVSMPTHSSSRIILGFSTSSTSNRPSGGASKGIGNNSDLGVGTYEVDISGLTGSYYFMYYGRYGGWYHFSEIYLT